MIWLILNITLFHYWVYQITLFHNYHLFVRRGVSTNKSPSSVVGKYTALLSTALQLSRLMLRNDNTKDWIFRVVVYYQESLYTCGYWVWWFSHWNVTLEKWFVSSTILYIYFIWWLTFSQMLFEICFTVNVFREFFSYRKRIIK